MPLRIKAFEFNMFGVNTYIVWDPITLSTIIVDPGMINKTEAHAIDLYISNNKLTPIYLINTHLHLDHTFGNDYIKARYRLKVSAHTDDTELGLKMAEQALRFGIRTELQPINIDLPLTHQQLIYLGKEPIRILHVPGHSQGGIALYAPDSDFVITGDSLFRGSIGRTDLHGGNQHQLQNSIRTTLLTLPDRTIIYPGHGPASTIGYEKEMNPYLQLY